MAKQKKMIKQLTRKVRRLKSRMDKMQADIRDLREKLDGALMEQSPAAAQGDTEAWPAKRFSEEEFEAADDITDEAEEVSDILEGR